MMVERKSKAGRKSKDANSKYRYLGVKVTPAQEEKLRELPESVSSLLRQGAYLFLLLKKHGAEPIRASRMEANFFELLLELANKGGTYNSPEFWELQDGRLMFSDTLEASMPTLLGNTVENAKYFADWLQEKGKGWREFMEDSIRGLGLNPESEIPANQYPMGKIIFAHLAHRPMELVVLGGYIFSYLKNYARAWEESEIIKKEAKR